MKLGTECDWQSRPNSCRYVSPSVNEWCMKLSTNVMRCGKTRKIKLRHKSLHSSKDVSYLSQQFSELDPLEFIAERIHPALSWRILRRGQLLLASALPLGSRGWLLSARQSRMQRRVPRLRLSIGSSPQVNFLHFQRSNGWSCNLGWRLRA